MENGKKAAAARTTMSGVAVVPVVESSSATLRATTNLPPSIASTEAGLAPIRESPKSTPFVSEAGEFSNGRLRICITLNVGGIRFVDVLLTSMVVSEDPRPRGCPGLTAGAGQLRPRPPTPSTSTSTSNPSPPPRPCSRRY